MIRERIFECHGERGIDTEFYRKASTGTLTELKELIAAGANPDAPIRNDIRDDFYAIHQAALNPDLEVLKYVVSLGVNPCRRDFWARQPLSFAVRENPLPFARYLVELGNRADECDDDGETVIAAAALNPHVEVLDYLLSLGADVNDGGMYDLPLGIALYKGTPERVKYFIDHGAELGWAIQVHGFCAPIENLRVVLENGCDPNWLDDEVDGTPTRVIDHLDPERQALFREFGGEVLNPNAEKFYKTYPSMMPKPTAARQWTHADETQPEAT